MGMDEERYLRLVAGSQMLGTMDPKTLEAKVDALAELFQCDKSIVQAAAASYHRCASCAFGCVCVCGGGCLAPWAPRLSGPCTVFTMQLSERKHSAAINSSTCNRPPPPPQPHHNEHPGV